MRDTQSTRKIVAGLLLRLNVVLVVMSVRCVKSLGSRVVDWELRMGHVRRAGGRVRVEYCNSSCQRRSCWR